MMRLLRRLCLALLCAAGVASPGAEAQSLTNIVPAPLNRPTVLALDRGGNLYALNEALLEIPLSVANGPDSLLRIAPDGTATAVSAPGVSAPGVSLGGLAVDPGGRVYVADSTNGSVDEVAPDGSLSPFVGPDQGLSRPGPLAFDAAGNLYVGNQGNNTISKVTPAGTVSTFVSSAWGIAPTTLAVDPGGTLYIGGFPANGAPAVVKVTAAGTLQPVLDLTQPPLEMGFDPQGNLYVCVCTGSVGIEEYSPAGTLLADFGAGDYPIGLAVDAASNVYFTAAPVSQSGAPEGSFIRKRNAAGAISTFSADPLAGPAAVALNPAGGYYVLENGGSIDKVSAQGEITPFVSGFLMPRYLVIDPAGTLYVGDTFGISKVSPAGAITAGFSGHTGPLAIDPKGNLYVADAGPNADARQIFQITPSGSSLMVGQIPSTSVVPIGLAVDAAGDFYALTFQPSPGPIGITTGLWELTRTTTIIRSLAAKAIVLDSSGRLYYSDFGGIELLMPDGTSRRVLLSPDAAALADLIFDAAGTLYGVNDGNNTLIAATLPDPDLAAAVLPGSRSVQLGQPADVLASVINAGATALNGCGIALPSDAPAGLSLTYQTTDPATNALIGTANQPVTIAPGATQSFVIGLTDSAPLVDPGQAIRFGCAGGAPAQSIAGVNTVDLLFSAQPVPDIIALAATSSGDGIVSVPLSSGGAAFAAATTNAGAAAAITVSADTGSAKLGLRISLCQTDPQTAQCLAPAADSVTLTIPAGATPTFSVFLVAASDIAFDPGTARVFLRFRDAVGALHGSTSVAVETN